MNVVVNYDNGTAIMFDFQVEPRNVTHMLILQPNTVLFDGSVCCCASSQYPAHPLNRDAPLRTCGRIALSPHSRLTHKCVRPALL